jgi:hypothetical protein
MVETICGHMRKMFECHPYSLRLIATTEIISHIRNTKILFVKLRSAGEFFNQLIKLLKARIFKLKL